MARSGGVMARHSISSSPKSGGMPRERPTSSVSSRAAAGVVVCLVHRAAGKDEHAGHEAVMQGAAGHQQRGLGAGVVDDQQAGRRPRVHGDAGGRLGNIIAHGT
jgi:hypothetical protein